MNGREPSSDLLRGRRALDGIRELRLVRDLAWNLETRMWFLCVDVRLEVASPHLPATSRWCIAVDDGYPLGQVTTLPARDGGIVATFPHQARNAVFADDRPWRRGAPCIEGSLATLGRAAGDVEPKDADSRLAWRAERLVTWCRHAANGTLQKPGEPFELPELPDGPDFARSVAYLEEPSVFARWTGVAPGQCGTFEWSEQDDWLVVRRFVGPNGSILATNPWGTWLVEKALVHRGAWVVVPSFPAVPPWGVPSTWGELRGAMGAAGVNLDTALTRALRVVRHEPDPLLMIGHPMPAVVDGPMTEMNWLAMEIPCWDEQIPAPGRPRGGRRHRSRAMPPPGVRSRVGSLAAYERAAFCRDAQAIVWRDTENLSESRLRARGALDDALTSRRILLVGGGALGSLLAESLVRSGARNLVIFDGEDFDPGNVTRHTLTLHDVGVSKAVALAERLASISPSLRVTGVPDTIRKQRKQFGLALRDADVVVDCTGADGVLDTLAAMGAQSRMIDWFSISLGLVGRRLYFFHARTTAFSAADFYRLQAPWEPSDAAALHAADLPREGIGCWHPLFPARNDQVALAAAVALRRMHDRMRIPGDTPSSLTVFEEQHDGDGTFVGFQVQTAPR